MNPNSRYQDADFLRAPARNYDELGLHEVYEDTGESRVEVRAAIYRLPTLPMPEPPEQQRMVRVTDRYHLLAKQSLNSSTLWWVVAEANPQIRHPLDIKAGDVIYMP